MPHLSPRITAAIVSMWFLLGGDGRPWSKESDFGWLGEGYTAGDFSEGIVARWRMFSAPDWPARCAAAERPARLIAREDHIVVRVGETFSLRDLSVIAVDADGRPLKPIPITVDMEGKEPELVDTWDFRGAGDGLLALRPGTFRLWIRPVCTDSGGPNPHKGIFIRYTIKAKR